MITTEEKQAMIENRIKYYEAKIFELEMDKAASVVNGESAEHIDKNIEGLRKAIQAVEELNLASIK